MVFKMDVPTIRRTHIIYKHLDLHRPRIHLCTAFKVDVPTLGHTHIMFKHLDLLRPRIHLCTALKVDVPTLGRTSIKDKILRFAQAQNTFMYGFQGGCPNIRAYTYYI